MENKVPEFLIDLLKKQYGEELTKDIIRGYSVKRKVTFRVNTLKSDVNKIKLELERNNIEYEKVSWYEDAFIVQNVDEEVLRNMDIYKNGEIYMQSLSSMLPPIILNPAQGKDILDMAAAPGGKTTQIAALTCNKAHITACEINKIRADRLKYNLEKQGAKNVFLMQKDARYIDDFFSFDQILLDSPCSGSGTLDLNDKNLDKNFTEKLVDNCTRFQYSLLKKAIKVLKPGSDMVYSTCSILQKENEDILNKILKEEKNIKIVPIEFKDEKIKLLPVKIPGTLCVMPDELYEGFFIAKLVKY